MATKKSSSKRSASSTGKTKVKKVMREYKEGELKSGGRKPVKSRKQAVAIALSEARRAGAKIPAKGAAKKKSSARKSSPARKKSSSSRKRS